MTITPVSLFSDEYTSLNNIHSTYGITGANEADRATRTSDPTSFETIFNAAVDMYKEADSLQKAAESAEMSFALGYTDSILDVANAQRKSSIALQYTVRVTNAVVTAYKELMNMQL